MVTNIWQFTEHSHIYFLKMPRDPKANDCLLPRKMRGVYTYPGPWKRNEIWTAGMKGKERPVNKTMEGFFQLNMLWELPAIELGFGKGLCLGCVTESPGELIKILMDFPRGPVVKILHFQFRGHGFYPGLGTKIPYTIQRGPPPKIFKQNTDTQVPLWDILNHWSWVKPGHEWFFSFPDETNMQWV